MLRVVYLSPILIEAFFAPPTLCVPQCEERSDQIEGTEATRGPRQLKGLVVVTESQGHGEHPAAASRRGTLGNSFTTTQLSASGLINRRH